MNADSTLPTLTEAVTLTRNSELTAVELVSLSLGCIHELDPHLKAFVSVLDERATEEARRLDGLPPAARGPLHGIPIAIKDIFDVAGTPTRRGSAAFADALPAISDADAVRRLRAAGAVVVGKTRTHELACGVFTSPTCNPWNTSRSAGGSSGGSGAAVAAGMVYAATGSDTGGSIRIPAALCGIVGLKATYGRVSRAGAASLAWSLDHVGALTRSVSDARIVDGVLAGSDPHDPATWTRSDAQDAPLAESGGSLRLGLPAECFRDGMSEAVATAWHSALTRLLDHGVDVVEFSIPSLKDALEAEYTIVMAEAATYYENLLAHDPKRIGEGVRQLLEGGAQTPALAYLRAQRFRTHLAAEFRTAFNRLDLNAVLTPTVPTTAQRPDQVFLNDRDGETVADAFVRTTGPFNLTGMPCFSLPAGLAVDGLPFGIQLAGRPFDESALFSTALAIEAILGPAPRPPDDYVGRLHSGHNELEGDHS